MKLAAHYIFPICAPPVRNGILTMSDSGEVLAIEEGGDSIDEREGVAFHSGIIVPGFVNAHCHLELSHLKGLLPEALGLAEFVTGISKHRHSVADSDVERAMRLADAQMLAGGTVAAGDISNTCHSFVVKADSQIRYHTFVERFGLRPDDIPYSIATAKAGVGEAKLLGLSASITPHAPYSTCHEMYEAIRLANPTPAPLWSVHNQESEDENAYFVSGTGALRRQLASLGLPLPEPSGMSSVHHTMQHVQPAQTLTLVHNVFTSSDDCDYAQSLCPHITWALCCRSNHYIGRAQPPIDMLRAKRANIALGTDSLASNHSLLMLDELRFVAQRYPHIPLTELLTWATLGGARALGCDDVLGSFERGKKPGAVLLSPVNLDALSLTHETQAHLLTKKLLPLRPF